MWSYVQHTNIRVKTLPEQLQQQELWLTLVWLVVALYFLLFFGSFQHFCTACFRAARTFDLLRCIVSWCSVWQCVAVSVLHVSRSTLDQDLLICCSVMQCVAVCCSVLQCVAESMLHVSRSTLDQDLLARTSDLLQCVALCCRECVALWHWALWTKPSPHNLRNCCSVLQCVAVCCSVLWRVAVSVLHNGTKTVTEALFARTSEPLQCVAVCCSVLQCVAVCCSMLQCVVVCCSVLQRVVMRMLQCGAKDFEWSPSRTHFESVAVYCSALQYAAACCSVLQRVAVCCSVLQESTFAECSLFYRALLQMRPIIWRDLLIVATP